MSATHIIVEGVLKPDGTLELDSKVTLPPGRVQLIVQSLADLPIGDPFWQTMERVWAGQRARGQLARTKEEIDHEINAMRDEADDEMCEAEQLHDDECRAARDLPAEDARGN